MYVKQIYTKCLSQASYYIESGGEAVVIDPLRDVNEYIKIADHASVKIKYVIETHFHADFVSGHLTLAKLTGAKIIYGPNADPKFDAIIATDNQVFKFGKVTLTTIHTPGHTLESTSFLLKDKNGKEHSIFTGDTLFLGDVGIPDVAQRYKGLSKEDLAGILFDSINKRIKPLPNDILVYPAHGAGSACGKKMMKQTIDNLGNQKEVNYSLNNSCNKNEFVKLLTDNLPEPPSYFPYNVKLNQEGYDDLSEILKRSNNPFSVEDFEKKMNLNGVKILDVRSHYDFCLGHIPNSIFIGIDGGFAPWVGAIFSDVNQPILLVADESRVEEIITRLSRIGFDNVLGYLEGGFKSWQQKNNYNKVNSIDSNQFYSKKFENSKILDVRNSSELESIGKVSGAKNISLQNLLSQIDDLEVNSEYLVFCAGGYRSVIAASILQANSFKYVYNILGGFNSIKGHL
ncbi:MAG: MBL fold metallo-hydrolase [Flavobacteriales bacterium]|nr:MBL fold metallo-hydrolase [Flavobacteriales bacterium]